MQISNQIKSKIFISDNMVHSYTTTILNKSMTKIALNEYDNNELNYHKKRTNRKKGAIEKLNNCRPTST